MGGIKTAQVTTPVVISIDFQNATNNTNVNMASGAALAVKIDTSALNAAATGATSDLGRSVQLVTPAAILTTLSDASAVYTSIRYNEQGENKTGSLSFSIPAGGAANVPNDANILLAMQIVIDVPFSRESGHSYTITKLGEVLKPVPSKESANPTDKEQITITLIDSPGPNASPEGQVIIKDSAITVYDGVRDGTFKDPIEVIKEGEQTPNNSPSSSGCSAFDGADLLLLTAGLAAIAIRAKNKKSHTKL